MISLLRDCTTLIFAKVRLKLYWGTMRKIRRRHNYFQGVVTPETRDLAVRCTGGSLGVVSADGCQYTSSA